MTNNLYAKPGKIGWRPGVSFWVTAALWLLFLIVAVPMGGFGAWLVLFALFLILTALYSLIFGRKSWLGLPSRKGAGGAVGSGVAVLIAGVMVVGLTAPAPGVGATLADVQTTPTAPATSSATPKAKASVKVTPSATGLATPAPTPSSAERLILLAACLEDGASVVQGGQTVVCTLDDAGVLVWMTEKESKTLLQARADSKRAAEVQASADKAAADVAARAAAEKAAVDEVARVVAEKAAADEAWVAAQHAEAQRVVAQQAADDAAWVAAQQAEADRAAAELAAQQAPPIQPLVEAPSSAYYPNCAAARAAGAAPLYAGQPGYSGALDRDKDGIACE